MEMFSGAPPGHFASADRVKCSARMDGKVLFWAQIASFEWLSPGEKPLHLVSLQRPVPVCCPFLSLSLGINLEQANEIKAMHYFTQR
ncbi:hypothetical protein Ciccas_013337 [Cichlidogyrus casuarinus]|uniref:Uncharacterized protein n=1 Tax=Cichlidogyrus casuarinus TaxID=1844966 RepID=A0ABD2PMN2_9PLAT